ncbi:Uncharacterized protein TCM_040580 [Theobroma cacao]|uniref:Reverse transcriptase zinc-binding domain-containing protein n=1 Tax=Theobroma cacao TaxID=3641 RepID=A0A061GSU8_THECC|nr:Uncharacterized protein TCM_040580 [Theobroma cacao]
MSCISTIVVSILVNGLLTREVCMKKRLRQSCRLSPLLFNLVVEAFSALMYKAVGRQLTIWVTVGSLESLWKSIVVEKSDLDHNNLIPSLGNGAKSTFRRKNELKVAFDLVVKKKDKIDDFCEWIGQTFGREFHDKLIWKRKTSGEYSPKSLCGHVMLSNTALVGILSVDAATCLLCKRESKFVSHLFFTCKILTTVTTIDSKVEHEMGKKWDGGKIFELVEVRVVWWMNAKWTNLNISIRDVGRLSWRIKYWRHFEQQTSGDTCPFSKAIGSSNSNEAKLLAVKEATLTYAASRWSSSPSVFLECDNNNVVKWITEPVEVA